MSFRDRIRERALRAAGVSGEESELPEEQAEQDPYDVLGVHRDATDEEIKNSYRELARRYHPDLNPDDPAADAKFKELGAAYALLKDPQARSDYDRGERPFTPSEVDVERVDPLSLFEQLIAPRGESFAGSGAVVIRLSPEQMHNGTTIRVRVGKRPVPVQVPPRSVPGSTVRLPDGRIAELQPKLP